MWLTVPADTFCSVLPYNVRCDKCGGNKTQISIEALGYFHERNNLPFTFIIYDFRIKFIFFRTRPSTSWTIILLILCC